MGLDITWYRGLTRAAGTEGLLDDGETDYEAGWENIYGNGDYFPGRADDVPEGRYKAEESDGFRAGSYSGYGRWRDQLAALAGYPAAKAADFDSRDRSYVEGHPHSAAAWSEENNGLPCYELVNFSDCEGTLGTAVCAKLAKDFAALQEKADAHPDAYFREKYREWRNAFEKASDRGAVCFH